MLHELYSNEWPIYTAEARNLYRNNAFFVTQSYGIPLQRLTESDFSMANLSAEMCIRDRVKIDCGSATMSARVTPSSESIAAGSTASASEPTTGTITNQTRHILNLNQIKNILSGQTFQLVELLTTQLLLVWISKEKNKQYLKVEYL